MIYQQKKITVAPTNWASQLLQKTEKIQNSKRTNPYTIWHGNEHHGTAGNAKQIFHLFQVKLIISSWKHTSFGDKSKCT